MTMSFDAQSSRPFPALLGVHTIIEPPNKQSTTHGAPSEAIIEFGRPMLRLPKI